MVKKACSQEGEAGHATYICNHETQSEQQVDPQASQTEPPVQDQLLKQLSLWGSFYVQTTTANS